MDCCFTALRKKGILLEIKPNRVLKKSPKRTFSADDISGNPAIPAESLGSQAALWAYFYFFSSLLKFS